MLHIYNEKTGVDVVINAETYDYVTAFKLSEKQIEDLKNNNNVT